MNTQYQQTMFNTNAEINNNSDKALILYRPEHKTNKPKRTTIRIPSQPIKSNDDLSVALNYLKRNTRYSNTQLRDYTMFMLGINIGRRIGDLLNLTVGDITHSDNTIKTKFYIITEKTNNQELVYLTDAVKSILSEYLNKHHYLLENKSNHLFPSRQSKLNIFTNGIDSMKYRNAMTIFENIEREVNKLKVNDDLIHISTHSLRKTYAYNYIITHRNDMYALMILSKALGHKNIETTFHYAGIEAEDISDTFKQDIGIGM